MKYNKYKSRTPIQTRNAIINERKRSAKYWKDFDKYQEEHRWDDLEYEGGLNNFEEAIAADRIDILEEHFRRGERKLNENVVFHPYMDFMLRLPLILAIECKSYKTILFLLEKGASPDAFCRNTGMTPYQFAKDNSIKAVHIFDNYKNGIMTKVKQKPHKKKDEDDQEEEKTDKTTTQPKKGKPNYGLGGILNIMQAISYEDIDYLKKHLTKGSSSLNENIVYPMPPGFRQLLPLLKAIKSHAYKSLQFLLEYGADPDVPDANLYMTPRQYAKENDEKAYQIISTFSGSQS